MSPTPTCSAAGTSSASALRSSRLYRFCADTNGVAPAVRALQSASTTCHAAKFDEPMYRTLPSTTSSCRAASVSSIGVTGSGACIWNRST